MANDDFAVVVGISRYPSISDLKGPENDARNFHDWLLASHGGQVPKQNAKLILSSDFTAAETPEDAEPTTERIDRSFGQLVRRGMSNNGRVGRRLYIYLAGHGFAPNIDEAALLMANAGLGFFGNHIPGRSYANWFRKAAYFTEVVLFMDCCRDVFPKASFHPPPWDSIQTQGAATLHLFGFATEWSRKSREKPDSNGQVQGVFTKALLAGLSGQASNPQGHVTGDSLKRFVLNFLPTLLNENERQEPKFEGDDIVLVEGSPPKGTPVRITFNRILPGQLVDLIDSARQVIATRPASADTWEIALNKGFYKLQAQNGGNDHMFEVIGEEVVNVQF